MPSSEAGALRSQDVRTTGDPTGLAGSLIRIDPDTGVAAADNPLVASSDPNTRRIVAHGLRNPFRLTMRPGTDELYIGDVGNSHWEEIERFELTPGPATPTTLTNFGWPCYEANAPTDGWQALGIAMCDDLYGAPSAVASPLYAYDHNGTAAPCGQAGNTTASITGLAFYDAAASDQTPFPARYDGALFFVDYSRDCMGVLLPDDDGVPDPDSMEVVATGLGNPVDLVLGPHGDLYYPDLLGGAINRIRYAAQPVAHATANPRVSTAPVTVTLDGSGSRDPDIDGTLVAWHWDLDHDGVFNEPGDASGEIVQWSITTAGVYPVTLKVVSSTGLTDTVDLEIDASNIPPQPSIDQPQPDLAWSAGETVTFSGSASDAEDGAIPASGLDWTVGLLHCGPSDCHEHVVQTFHGVAGGEVEAPDHDYPARLVLHLSATDSDGAVRSTSLEFEPATVEFTAASDPVGVPITVGDDEVPAPTTTTLIRGGSVELSAPATFSDDGLAYRFGAWSDGSPARHRDLTVSESTTLTAMYVADAPDTCADARPIARDTWVPQHTTGDDDEDWYVFTLNAAREAVLTLGDLKVNASLELYGECDTLLAASDLAGTHVEQLLPTLPAGTYRVRVHVPSGAESASPWVVRLSTSGPKLLVNSARASRSSGIVRVSGEVLNLTGTVTGRATVVARLRDADGDIVGTLSGTTFAPRLLDRSVTPFRLSGRAPAFASVTFTLTPGTPTSDRTLVLRGLTTTPNASGTATLTGKVRNDDTRRAPDVAVARTSYGARGEVLDVRIASTDPSRLDSGERGAFTLHVPALDRRAGHDAGDARPLTADGGAALRPTPWAGARSGGRRRRA